MKNFDENELIDKAMAGRLTADEQRLWEALLAERPELEAELQIGRALRAMTKPPQVSTNFTALVLREINTPVIEERRSGWLQWLRFPRLARIAAVVAVGIIMGGTTIHRRAEEQRVAESVRNFAGGIAAVTTEANGVRPELVMSVLNDFEAIQRLPADETYVDNGLLAVLGE